MLLRLGVKESPYRGHQIDGPGPDGGRVALVALQQSSERTVDVKAFGEERGDLPEFKDAMKNM